MQDTNNKKAGKKPYQTPEVKKIRLDAEVLLLAGCKLATSKTNKQCTAAACGNKVVSS